MTFLCTDEDALDGGRYVLNEALLAMLEAGVERDAGAQTRGQSASRSR